MPKKPTLTTTAGAPITDNQNSITAGPRGPACRKTTSSSRNLLIRTSLVAHGARQGLGRAWHAHHYGRHFQIYQGGGAASWRKTPMLARFLIVAGELGAADAERDVGGFALKFYTEEGNWDLVWQQHAVVPASGIGCGRNKLSEAVECGDWRVDTSPRASHIMSPGL